MRLPKKYAWIQVAALAVLAAGYALVRTSGITADAPADSTPAAVYTVSRVVDGDTLKLSNGERVRLIGVDTPEVHYSDKLLRDARKAGKDVKEIQALGKRASAFTKALCADKKVRLEYDIDKRDRYGRLLAYAYLEDGTFVNRRIIEEGYGQVLTVPPNVKHADEFRRSQQLAREQGKGLWGDAIYGRDQVP